MSAKATKKAPSKKKPRKPAVPRKVHDNATSEGLERYLPLAGLAVGLLALLGLAVYVVGAQPRRRVAQEPSATALATVVPESLYARIHARHTHASDAFTQGLVWDRGRLFESTGLEGRSSLRELRLESGDVIRRVDDEATVFAEGLALVGDELVQLTWQNHRALVWSRDGFRKLREHRYVGEGWGLCHDGENLVMSDGSELLTFRDPETFEVRRDVRVTRLGRPQRMLNELECVRGKIYANVWQTDEIVRIDPATGAIDAVVDASGLLTDAERLDADVLNGIAFVPETGRFLVTGKLWPVLFEVTFESSR